MCVLVKQTHIKYNTIIIIYSVRDDHDGVIVSRGRASTWDFFFASTPQIAPLSPLLVSAAATAAASLMCVESAIDKGQIECSKSQSSTCACVGKHTEVVNLSNSVQFELMRSVRNFSMRFQGDSHCAGAVGLGQRKVAQNSKSCDNDLFEFSFSFIIQLLF